MYCYNCGKQIYNGMQKCPYCDIMIDKSEISQLVLENTWSEIAEKCPCFSEASEKIFYVDGRKISISGDTYIYASINSFMCNLYNQTYETLSSYYDNSSFDTLVSDGENFLKKKLNNVGNAILGFKYKNSGIITDDDKMGFLLLAKHVEFAWAPIYAVAEEFDDLKELLSERRKAMNVERTSEWVGGGIGISGAIKGKIQADILNAGASVANSAGNFVRRSIQAGIDRSNINELKKEVKNNPELKDAVFSEIKKFFVDWTNILSAIFLHDSKKQDKVYLQMMDNFDTEDILSYSESLDKLEKNPYCILAYSSIYYHNRKAGEALSQMAVFCGIAEMVLPTFQVVDRRQLDEGKLKLPTVGFDTEESELLKIKERLLELEKNNPAYVLDLPTLKNEDTIREQRYHKKVDELISIIRIEKIKPIVEKTFEKNNLKDASCILLNKRDCFIDNLIFRKYLWILSQEGSDAFISKFNSEIPQLATDALLVYLHGRNSSKYDSALEAVAKLGHPFVMAYYGEYCYKDGNKEIGVDYLVKAAKQNCALALRYLGIFYKSGLAGFYRDYDTAKSYLSVAIALGDYESKKEL